MSEIKVNKITPRVACGTTTLGDSGDTIAIAAGVNATLGGAGSTITVPSGATISNLGTATGFGGTGVVSWETSSIKTAGFTAVTGTGYFCNTTAGAFSVTLPLSPSAGDVVGVSDYAKTFDTDNCTLLRNGSNIGGSAADGTLAAEGTAVTLVYVDATKGWIVTDSGNQADVPTQKFVAATGGCITTCGDYKVHTFTGPGPFNVSCAGNSEGSNSTDYLVVAGAGAGGGRYGGGGGAGGYRESPGTASGSYSVSPRGVSPAAAISVSVQDYTITVGGGGAGVPAVPGSISGGTGGLSTFDTITSAAGTGGGGQGVGASAGGSGGGGSYASGGGAGDTPPTPVAQGMPGAGGWPGSPYSTGGGGGATEAGGAASASPPTGGRGGTGATTSISFASVSYSGGGGGSGEGSHGVTAGAASPCGTGTAGAASNTNSGNGAINKGGGSGGAFYPGPSSSSGNGGSGVVIIRYKFQ